ncbi:ATP-dependent DNA helicase PIF1-like protein [Tanacetum coccineum]
MNNGPSSVPGSTWIDLKQKATASTSKYVFTPSKRRSAGPIHIRAAKKLPKRAAFASAEGKMLLSRFNETPSSLNRLLDYNDPATLSDRRTSRRYNAPIVSEVTALITNAFGDGIPTRDIIVSDKDTGPKRISELHPRYIALQYPCCFHMEKMASMLRYLITPIQAGTTLLRGGRLLQQYLVDAYTAIEEQRLKWMRNNQDTLRVELYHNLCDAVTRVAYVIEFQKHGLPHAHILLWLEECCKCKTPNEIDDIISVELPSLIDDPEGYKVVTEYMLHGPCAETMIDEERYAIYHRRDNKVYAVKGKFTYDNKYVVPYNRYLLLKYQAHINVEWCNRSKVVEVDEIKNFLNCRFLAPCEAISHLFSFDIHYSYPSVMKLHFHLPNQNAATLHDSESLSAMLEREVLLGGDFRQILPVIPKGKRQDVIIVEMYPNFTARQTDDGYLKERAILNLRNDDVDVINEYMFQKDATACLMLKKGTPHNVLTECYQAREYAMDLGLFKNHGQSNTHGGRVNALEREDSWQNVLRCWKGDLRHAPWTETLSRYNNVHETCRGRERKNTQRYGA